MLDKHLSIYLDTLGLSEKDKTEFIDTYNDLSIEEKSYFLYQISDGVYKEYPVDIKTFVHHPDYLGSIYSEIIYPIWDDLLQKIYPAPLINRYNEVILSCATRSGKSTAAAISFLYEMYKVMCMVDPAKFLVGKSTARLVFAVLSKDDNQAVMGISTDIEKALTSSPYFIKKVSKKLAFSSLTKSGVEITDNIILKAGSQVGSITGSDLYCGLLDEANEPSKSIAQDELVAKRMFMYGAMIDRKESTLSKAPPGSGIIWMLSQPRDEGDVIGERINDVRSNNIPNVLILDNVARWEARNEYKDETFNFYLGSDTKDPCIIDNDEELYKYEPEKIIKIPYTPEYYSKFQINPRLSIQEIAGRRTVAENALFNSAAVFDKVFYKDNDIFTKDELAINFGKKLDFSDYLIDADYFKNCKDRNCYRYIHLDIASKTDRFGLSSVYSNRLRFKAEDGTEISRRMFYVDFCLGIVSSSGQPVDILKVLEFVYGLKKLGYPVKLVTTDSHQGELARQIIRRNGVDTQYLSVETSKEPYLNLKNLILTEHLIGYKNPILIKELRGLKEDDKKIGKSKGYTDDLSDSLAGALYACLGDRYYKKNNETLDDLINLNNSKKSQGSIEIINSLEAIHYLNNNLIPPDVNIYDNIYRNDNNNGRLGSGY